MSAGAGIMQEVTQAAAGEDDDSTHQLQSTGDLAAALMAAATFSQEEQMRMIIDLISTGDQMVARAVQVQVAAVLACRDQTPAEPATTAAVAATTDPEAQATRMWQNFEDAKQKIPKALGSIVDAEQVCGGYEPSLREAAHRLSNAFEGPEGLALNAGDAQRLIGRILALCEPAFEKALKGAKKNVNDIVVSACKAMCVDLKDRNAFIVKMTEAYRGDLDKEVLCELLNAYRQDPSNQECGFLSNAQQNASLRPNGKARPRKRRYAKGGEDDQPQGGSGACGSSESPPNFWIPSELLAEPDTVSNLSVSAPAFISIAHLNYQPP